MMSTAPVRLLRIVVVDDHPIVLKGLVELINEEPDLSVCGEATTPAGATATVTAQHPDVVIVDLSLGSESGLDLVKTLVASHPEVRVLVLSGHDERLYADRALKAGARGYIMKDQGGTELLLAVRRVAQGKTYVSGQVAERILSTLGGRRIGSETSPLDRLTDRERHVLALLGRGLGTQEIAQQLTIAVKTVESHCAHIKEKLGIGSARQLARFAVTWTEGQSG